MTKATLKHFHLYVVSAEKDLYSGRVVEVFASGSNGDFQVLPGHVEFLTLLRPGVLSFREAVGTKKKSIYVSGGIVEVQPQEMTILADAALRVDELDEERLNQAQQEIRHKLATATGADYSMALSQLSQVLAQCRTLKTE